ncbi:MAG: isopentenyl phosphate kinase family protein [Cyanothece sp. SIO1E1]|nr:isopentenyl phosphate kinase family protein [Cyanothece sp. SIO1E1]
MEICLIKIGGSLITNKSKLDTLRPEAIEQIAQEISEIISLKPDLKIVLINGNGSIGHPVVKKYQVNQGANGTNTIGFCKLQQATVRLNRIFVDALLAHSIPAISFQTSTVFWGENQEYYHASLKTIEQLLINQIIPVLYGDGIVDQDQGFNIISSDNILILLAIHFLKSKQAQINKVINLGNYAGVLDGQGKLIKEINSTNYASLKQHIKGSQHLDISGGMAHKIQTLLELAQLGCESWIINGSQKDNLKNLILNNQPMGTKVC